MSDKSSLQTDEAVKEPMDTQSEFGEKMIQWRENAGLNRKEFAQTECFTDCCKKLGNRTLHSQSHKIQ